MGEVADQRGRHGRLRSSRRSSLFVSRLGVSSHCRDFRFDPGQRIPDPELDSRRDQQFPHHTVLKCLDLHRGLRGVHNSHEIPTFDPIARSDEPLDERRLVHVGAE
jgi:hypothetical protein